MSVNKKSLMYCQISHKSTTYEVYVGVTDTDELNDILQDWAISNTTIAEALDLPADLVICQAITDYLTTNDSDGYVYIKSAVSAYMDKVKNAGLTGTFPTLPTALVAEKYVLPATTAFVFSAASFAGVFGEYTIPTASFELATGVNIIGIDYNAGTPQYQIYSDISSVNYSSIIPVCKVLYFNSNIYSIPLGVSGDGLAEKIIADQRKQHQYVLIDEFTLTHDSNLYTQIGALSVTHGLDTIAPLAFDSSLSNNDLYLYYKNSSSEWQTSKVTQLNNLQYQGAGLVALADGEYVANYLYRLVDGTNKLAFTVLSGKFTSLQDAINSAPVSIPDTIKNSSVIVGRIIFAKGSTTGTVQKVQKIVFGI